MKKSIFILIAFSPLLAFSQSLKQHQTNFYDIQKAFYAKHPMALPWNRDQKENIDSNEPSSGEKYEDGEIERFKRWENFMEPRVYPTGNFPDPGILMREYIKYKQSYPASTRTGDWQLIGPDLNPPGAPLSGVGRINTIAINPLDENIIYAGAACGGLWKSIDGGNTWTSNNSDLLPSISIGDIAINPIHPDTMYVATGDSPGMEVLDAYGGHFGGTYSAGLMMSTDAGETWATTGLSYDQPDAQVIYRVIVNPDNPSVLLAATRGGLYRSADAGITWSKQIEGYFFDVEFNATNSTIVYAVNDSNFFSSIDGGLTWSQNVTPLQVGCPDCRISIGVTPANSNYIYAWTQNGPFYVSTNGGSSFATTTSPLAYTWSQGAYDIVLTVSPVDKKTVLAGGVNLARTTNGGVTWEVIGGGYSIGPNKIHPDFHAMVYYPNDGTKLLAGNDGGVFKSTTGSFPWIDISNGMAIKQYYRMANSPVDQDYILAGAQDNGTDKHDGTNWTHVFLADGEQPLVDYENDRINFVTFQNGYLARSSDGCASLATINPTDPTGQYNYSGYWTTPYVLDPSNHHHIYYGGKAYKVNGGTPYGTILQSKDDGLSWSQIMSEDAGALDFFYRVRVAPSNHDYIYASTLSQIFVTSDGGNTWTEIYNGLPSTAGGRTDIVISNDDPLKTWVTVSGYTDGEKVYLSEDGGLTWSNISGTLPNIPVNCIAFQRNANDMLYIGTDFGVFYRDNNMSDWLPINDGLPNVMVYQLDVLYSFNKLRAATYGRSIWETDLMVSAITNNDAGLLAVTNPSGSSCEPVAEIKTMLKNFGTAQLTSCVIHYAIDTGPEQLYSWSGNLSTGDTQTVDLGVTTFADGNHEVVVYTSDPNNAADENTDNDRRSGFTTITLAQAELPIHEGFENAFPPLLWHQTNLLWSSANAGGFFLSYHSMVALCYIESGNSSMVTPLFDIPNISPPAHLTFSHCYAPYPDPFWNDTLQVLVSADCFSTYDILFSKSGNELATTDPTYDPYIPVSASVWAKDTVDLSAYIGISDVQLAFKAISGFGNNLYVDDINLDLTPVLTTSISFGELNVFPNPTSGRVMIVNSGGEKIRAIEVRNAIGETVLIENEPSAFNASSSIDLSSFAKGLYLLHILTENGMMVKKIVVE